MQPIISVIITTKNEESVIRRLLLSVKAQIYKNSEIILVDNHSDDKTLSMAKEFTRKVYTFGPERSAQRNFGVRKSKGKYLLILDADMKLSKNVLSEGVEIFNQDKRIGSISIPEESIAVTFWEKIKSFERSFYNKDGDPTTDAARFFSREAFDKVGGYDETITGPEDWDLPERIVRAGYTQDRIKSKIYHYERVPNPIKLAKKKYYYALTSYRYLKKHNIPPLSEKTIYFLRPVFYRNLSVLIKHPFMSLAMFVMLTFEQIGGGFGYLLGKYRKL